MCSLAERRLSLLIRHPTNDGCASQTSGRLPICSNLVGCAGFAHPAVQFDQRGRSDSQHAVLVAGTRRWAHHWGLYERRALKAPNIIGVPERFQAIRLEFAQLLEKLKTAQDTLVACVKLYDDDDELALFSCLGDSVPIMKDRSDPGAVIRFRKPMRSPRCFNAMGYVKSKTAAAFAVSIDRQGLKQTAGRQVQT